MHVMVTNGGPHPPETWAISTAQVICPIDDDLQKTNGARHLAALKLQSAIAGALVAHHAAVQADERGSLSANAEAHLATDLDADTRAEVALAAVQKAAIGSPWDAHFQNPEVAKTIKHEIHVHFRTAQQIERQWHLDRKGA